MQTLDIAPLLPSSQRPSPQRRSSVPNSAAGNTIQLHLGHTQVSSRFQSPVLNPASVYLPVCRMLDVMLLAMLAKRACTVLGLTLPRSLTVWNMLEPSTLSPPTDSATEVRITGGLRGIEKSGCLLSLHCHWERLRFRCCDTLVLGPRTISLSAATKELRCSDTSLTFRTPAGSIAWSTEYLPGFLLKQQHDERTKSSWNVIEYI